MESVQPDEVVQGQVEEGSSSPIGPLPPQPKATKVNSEDEEEEIEDVVELPPNLAEPTKETKKRRKVKTLPHEHLFLKNLPSSPLYEISYMHRDFISCTVITKDDFVITASLDGHLKFWKKTGIQELTFVKHYKAHLGAIVGLAVSSNNQLLASISVDKTLKIFDIVNFDMINIIRLDYVPSHVSFVFQPGAIQSKVLCSYQDEAKLAVYDANGTNQPLQVIEDLHSVPVTCLAYHPQLDIVISGDSSGNFEMWSVDQPTAVPYQLSFQYKSETDLYDFKKHRAYPTSITLSPNLKYMATVSFTSDRTIRVFECKTGKLYRKYDEDLEVYFKLQKTAVDLYHLDEMEFGRRIAVEREWVNSTQAKFANAVFDESGHFLLYPTMLGIKVVNLVSNQVVSLLGKSETQRFINLALYQGAPTKKKGQTVAQVASANPLLQDSASTDPSLFATSYKKNRFYIFTQRNPFQEDSKADRDVFNEKPTREELTIAGAKGTSTTPSPHLHHTAVLHTTEGDIHLQLYPEDCPKTVENFCRLAKTNYYDNVTFHRIIKQFMIQTGDPLGDGTGGESIWHKYFEDELHPHLQHDQPYTLSMANAGPNTNGSQFFITTVPAPWLDNKHTVFGKVTHGMDVVHRIENYETDDLDRPEKEVEIVSVTIK